ncbi:hypothetical protein PPYR_08171 [Photinus pyralis]|uniref:MADF domain-containing protein n=1 Tax=Photinus pyralis TaxID=7054 RepID=A0A1Y1JYB7_PHOPY|nr:transcription factor Adf-1-like [Photinus pyralis]KAB0797177.1 hypothetical protein PPYR_08171 [Photinus pyralis]
MTDSDDIKIVVISDEEFKIVVNAEDENLIKYVYDLSKEMNIEGAHGVIGNELELIALVRNCNFLYDKTLSDFKDIRKKNVAWSAIANVLHCTVDEVKRRWHSLREAYNRYKKDAELGDANRDSIQWEFYEDMKFIDPFIYPRCTFGTLVSDNEDENNDGGETANHTSEDIQFILLVQSRPILYDKNHPQYKAKKVKAEVWNEVAKEINLTANECEQRWKSLRERYGRERKLRHVDQNRKKWVYFDILNFLDGHIKARRPSSFRSILPKIDNTNNLAIISPMNSRTVLLNMSPLHTEPREESVETHTDVDQVEFIDTSNTTHSPTTHYSKEANSVEQSRSMLNDEDELFGQSISAELRRMPSGKKKMKIKAEIYKILYENESD